MKLEKFVEEQKRCKADVVAILALMSTSMLAIPKAIKMLKGSVPTVIVMVGGAPLSADIASNMEPMYMRRCCKCCEGGQSTPQRLT